MKVLFLTIWYPNPANPVAGTFVHEQALALRAAGVDLRVMMPVPLAPFPLTLLSDSYHRLSALPDEEMHSGIPVYYPRYLTLPRHLLFERVGDWMYRAISKRLATIHKEWPFELIHAHTTYPCGQAANRCRDELFPQVKVVHTIHGTCIRDAPTYNLACFEKVRGSLQAANATVFVSRAGMRRGLEITQGCIADHSEYITNGVSSDRFSISEDDQKNVEALKSRHKDTWNLVFVGNLSELKGIKELLDGIRELVASGRKQLRLFLLGTNLLGRYIEDYLATHGLKEVVSVIGPVPHQQVKIWMRFANAFILPSHSEGTPTVLFEALFVGTPGIFTKVGGVGDIVTDGREALLIPPRSTPAIVQAIETLMDNPQLCRELSARGQQLIRSSFTWDNNARSTLGLYQRLLGQSPSAASAVS